MSFDVNVIIYYLLTSFEILFRTALNSGPCPVISASRALLPPWGLRTNTFHPFLIVQKCAKQLTDGAWGANFLLIAETAKAEQIECVLHLCMRVFVHYVI